MDKFSIIEESESYKKIVDLKTKKVQKFSEYQDQKEEISDIETVYDGYLKVKNNKGYEYVSESDCSVAMIHFVESNEVLFRLEPVPPFQDRENKKNHKYLTVLSGTIEQNEQPFDCLVREMIEEAGIVLNTSFDMLEYLGDCYFSKGNNAKYNIFYVPLYTNDYRTVKIKGDGSDVEKNSENIVIEVQYLNDITPSDTITALCVEKLKNRLKI